MTLSKGASGNAGKSKFALSVFVVGIVGLAILPQTVAARPLSECTAFTNLPSGLLGGYQVIDALSPQATHTWKFSLGGPGFVELVAPPGVSITVYEQAGSNCNAICSGSGVWGCPSSLGTTFVEIHNSLTVVAEYAVVADNQCC